MKPIIFHIPVGLSCCKGFFKSKNKRSEEKLLLRTYIDKALYADSRNEMQAILEEALDRMNEE